MPSSRSLVFFILAAMIFSSVALIQYDKIINQRLERIDPELLKELQTAQRHTLFPVILSVSDTSDLPGRIGTSKLTILNPYTHSKGYNALISTELKTFQIQKLIQAGAIDAIQKEATIQSLPTQINADPDKFSDFKEFQKRKITGEGIVVIKMDSGANPRWDYLGIYSVFGDDGIDRDGHGKQTEGILREVCTGCQIISVKILNDRGRGSFGGVIQGLDIIDKLADENHIDYLYGSFGSPGISGVITSVFASNIALNHQTVSFYAAGNEGKQNLYTPSSGKYVWDVRAINAENTITPFSNFGSKNSYLSISEYGFYKGEAGTSFSAPRVTAKMALVDSYYREKGVILSFNEKNILLSNAAEDLGAIGFDTVYGWGVVDSDSLLRANYKKRPLNLYKGSYADIMLRWIWGIGLFAIVMVSRKK